MWLQVAKNLAFSIASNPGFPFQILSHGYWQNWHNLERKAWVNFSPKLWDKICLGLRIHVLDCATVFSDSYAMCWDALRAFPAWLNALLALCTKTLSRLIASVDKKSWLCQCVGRKLGWRVRVQGFSWQRASDCLFSSDLGGLATARLSNNHHSAVLFHQVEDVVAILGNQ